MEEGSSLVTLEAMKMQNPLFAPMTGKVNQFILIDDTFLVIIVCGCLSVVG